MAAVKSSSEYTITSRATTTVFADSLCVRSRNCATPTKSTRPSVAPQAETRNKRIAERIHMKSDIDS
jgi:hypothetical protein